MPLAPSTEKPQPPATVQKIKHPPQPVPQQSAHQKRVGKAKR